MRYVPGNAQQTGSRQTAAFAFSDPKDARLMRHGGFLGVVVDGASAGQSGYEAATAAVHAFLAAHKTKQEAANIPDTLRRALRESRAAAASVAPVEELPTAAVVFHESSLYYVAAGGSIYLLRRGAASALSASGEGLRPFLLEPGDRVLVSTNALPATLPLPEMQAELAPALQRDPQRQCEALIRKVVEKNRDNVTVLCVGVERDVAAVPPPAPRRKNYAVAAATAIAAVILAGWWWWPKPQPASKKAEDRKEQKEQQKQKKDSAKDQAEKQEAKKQPEKQQEQEQAKQEQAKQEQAKQEQAKQEQAKQEQARQEQARQEQAKQEQARQEQARQEQAKQEQARQEQAKQAQAKQEQAKQEQARQEQAKQELAKREQEKQDQLKKQGKAQNPPPQGPSGAVGASGKFVYVDLNLGMVIPAGSVLVGSNKDRNEMPTRTFKITKPFEMGKYNVTQAQWKLVMNGNPSKFKGDDLPVETVSYDSVMVFLGAFNKNETKYIYRLPTEIEWIYACRAGASADPSPEELKDLAWTEENSDARTHPVGKKKPNAFGLYDMYGNVLEWCHDWFDPKYYSYAPEVDPQGPATGLNRALHGCTYLNSTAGCRAGARTALAPNGAGPAIGFRVVRQAR